MANVRPLKTGVGGTSQVAAADTVTVNAVDRISAGALGIGIATATSIEVGTTVQPDITNTVPLGSTSKAFSNVFLWDGVDGRSLSDATALASGSELVGVNRTDFANIVPLSDNLHSALLAVDDAFGSLVPANPDHIDITDDFHNIASGGSGWSFQKSGDVASGFGYSPSGSSLGNPSITAAVMYVGATDGTTASGANTALGLNLDGSSSVIRTFRFSIGGISPISPGGSLDDHCEWMVGSFHPAGDFEHVSLVALLNSGTYTRSGYVLRVSKLGVDHDTAVVLPPGGVYYDARITITAAGATCEVAVDGGAFVLLATSATAPSQGTYLAYAQIVVPTGGTGNRSLVLTRVRHQGLLSATMTPAGVEVQQIPTPMTDAEHTALAATATAASVTAVAFPGPVTETTTSRTLTDADNGKTIRCTNSGGCTIITPDTLTPGFSCSAFPDHATGHVTWDQSGTMVVQNSDGFNTASVRYAVSGVIVHSATLGIVTGALDS